MTHVPDDKVVRKLKFHGIPIDVQFEKGSTRSYPAANGYPAYSTKMQAIYGEVPDTKGTDGDPVDVYVGTAKSDKVFVIRQMKWPKYEAFDEEKCMLGFATAEAAKSCYLHHFENKKIFGGIKELTMEDFKARLGTKGVEGKKIANRALESMMAKTAADYADALKSRRDPHGLGDPVLDAALAHADTLLGNPTPFINELPMTTTPFNEATAGSSKEAARVPGRGDVTVRVREHLRRMRSKESARSDAERKGERKGARIGAVLGGSAAAGSVLHARTPKKEWLNAPRNPRIAKIKLPAAMVAGGMLAAGVGGVTGAELARQKAKREDGDGNQMAAAGGLVAGGAAGVGAGHVTAKHELSKLHTLAAHAAKGVHTGNAHPRIAERLKATKHKELSDAIDKITPTLRHKHRVQGFALGASAGALTGALLHHSLKKKKEAADDRVARIADRVDDVGIATLASPYIAGGLAKHLHGRAGVAGRVAAGAKAYHDAFGKNHRAEVAGLSLVAPGIVHPISKGIDKVLPGKVAMLEGYSPEEKIAFLGAVANMARTAVAAAPGAMGAVKTLGQRALGAGSAAAARAAAPLRTLSNVGKATAVVGAGLGTYGAVKGIQAAGGMLRNERENPIAPPSYAGPRLY